METPMARAEQSPVRKLAGMDDDRLSSLPDEILSYIISFLPTKFAVGTAVLGRRWKHLWTRVCNLDFDNTIWGCHGAKSRHRKPSCNTRRDKYFGFCRFVDRVLSEHKNLDSLKRLSLHFEEGYPYSYGNRYLWLKMGLGSGSLLEEIDVNFKAEDGTGPTFPMHRLPEFFYTLKHLRVLKLDGVVMETGSSVFLPNMKNLQLLRVKIVDGESLGRLLSGCPALDTAHLETDHMKIDEYLHRKEECKLIASLPCLKNLTIVRFHCITHWAIEAPSIEHLHLRSVVAELQFLGSSKFPCLDSVTVLGSVGMIWELCLLYFLQQISNAKELSFSWQPLAMLQFRCDFELPAFPNLTHLKLAVDASILHRFLNSAPNLQSLVICMESKLGDSMIRREPVPAYTPECLFSSLEKIKVMNFEGVEDEKKMVAYLLKAGAVLKEVNVHVPRRRGPEFGKLASLLKLLPRGSSACEVLVFDEDDYFDDSDQ